MGPEINSRGGIRYPSHVPRQSSPDIGLNKNIAYHIESNQTKSINEQEQKLIQHENNLDCTLINVLCNYCYHKTMWIVLTTFKVINLLHLVFYHIFVQ